MLEQYYIKRQNCEGTISFEPVDMSKITICGKTIEEIIDILNGLDAERITDIQMAVKNLKLYIDYFNKERQKMITNSFKNMKYLHEINNWGITQPLFKNEEGEDK